MEYKKKLIEVALPLEEINAASAREKSIRHGHPSTLHLWWARRPLAAARAVIWSSLVDDPSAHPEQFPTEKEQEKERQRLFGILTDLVKWENSNDEEVLNKAKAEILKSTDGNPPALLDPFAGGGAIPLEAQRLGLKAYASDLNPVAVMINKAMIEIPPRFAGQAPVNPEARAKLDDGKGWSGAHGLAEDVRYYGEWMKREAFKRIGRLYPKVKVPEEQGGGEATVIAWIWARTVKCPNPACGCEMPLVRSFSISKKKGKEAVIVPTVRKNTIEYTIKAGKDAVDGTINRKGAKCIFCGSAVPFEYIRRMGKDHLLGHQLIGIVAEGKKGRLFLPPTDEQFTIAEVQKPANCPSAPIPEKALGFRVQLYGMNHFEDLFTNRQLTALTTFSDLISAVGDKVKYDAVCAGLINDSAKLQNGGNQADAYSEAVMVYLSLLIDQLANQSSTLCSWHVNNIQMKSTFSRQSLPMVWDFAESNVFCSSSGSYHNMLDCLVNALSCFYQKNPGFAFQHNAMEIFNFTPNNLMISTDPPYYDNIGYADLSDYFYMWLRPNIKKIYPDIASTLMAPKSNELIATPFRFGGNYNKAKAYFETGMQHSFEIIKKSCSDNYPVTIFYAFKQTDVDEKSNEHYEVSTGWEAMLQALISAEFEIRGTWPMRTEMTTGVKQNINVLASSIVLVCRKRPADAPTCTRRDFVNALKRELKPALQELQNSNIAPVDLAQSAIGPGMGVYSRFAKVLEADGTPMSVRGALQIINQELDLYFNEQEGTLDRSSRFCIDLYTQHAFNEMKFGEADELARAKNTSVSAMENAGALYAQKGIVRLMTREEIPEKVNPDEHFIWLLTQQLTHAMETGGVNACAEIIAPMFGSNAESAKALAYRLYTIADRKGWAQEAFAYNAFVVAWPDIQSRAAQLQSQIPEQLTL